MRPLPGVDGCHRYDCRTGERGRGGPAPDGGASAQRDRRNEPDKEAWVKVERLQQEPDRRDRGGERERDRDCLAPRERGEAEHEQEADRRDRDARSAEDRSCQCEREVGPEVVRLTMRRLDHADADARVRDGAEGQRRDQPRYPPARKLAARDERGRLRRKRKQCVQVCRNASSRRGHVADARQPGFTAEQAREQHRRSDRRQCHQAVATYSSRFEGKGRVCGEQQSDARPGQHTPAARRPRGHERDRERGEQNRQHAQPRRAVPARRIDQMVKEREQRMIVEHPLAPKRIE